MSDPRSSTTLPEGRDPALRVIPMPADANANGPRHGQSQQAMDRAVQFLLARQGELGAWA